MTNTEEAVGHITSCCQWLGSFAGTFEPMKFLVRVAAEMQAAEPTSLFPVGHKEHIACALQMAVKQGFGSPSAAVASVYLVTRFERYFRILSGKLKPNGEWIGPAEKAAAIALLGQNGLNRPKVSNVAAAYRVMKLDQSRPASQVFDSLDKALFAAPYQATGGIPVTDVGSRIAFGRHSTGHGEWGDISSEAIFYGLVTAIVFNNQT